MLESLGRLLDDAWADLDVGNYMGARSKARRAAVDPSLRPEALHLLGRISLQRNTPAQALALFEKSLALGYDTPDLYYDIGLSHEHLGNTAKRTAAFLEVLDRDSGYDIDLPTHLSEDLLVGIAEELLGELPAKITEKLGNVPILVDDRPSRDLVADGFDPRALGLFEGIPFPDEISAGPALNRILLFRVNIEAFTFSESDAVEQVRITLLHEIAHFFGMNEDEVTALGLG